MITVPKSKSSRLRRIITAGFIATMVWSVNMDTGTAFGQTKLDGGDLNVISCSTSSCLSSALKKVVAGNHIVLAPGTYTGSFSSDVQGTINLPITIESLDAAHPAVIAGYSTASGYDLRIRGDYWIIQNLKFTGAQKGILLDHSNYTKIQQVEVYNIGNEGVHFRDGTSYSTLQDSSIHDTGKAQAGYGEGVYVGSTDTAGYNQNTHYNTIRNVNFGPNIAAEPIDIKERTLGTLVENCTFHGQGISGENYADSFIDVKGSNAIIRNNLGYQEGNNVIVDAFQLHEVVSGCGMNNTFSNNTLYLTNASAYVIGAYNNTTATAMNNTRNPSGNMYKGNVKVQ